GAQPARAGTQRVGRRDDRAGLVDDRAPVRGQAHVAGRAVEDAQPKLVLQPADLLAEHLLGDPQLFGGAREVQLVGDGHGVAQATELGHGAIVTYHPRPVSPGERAAIRSPSWTNLRSSPCSPRPSTALRTSKTS